MDLGELFRVIRRRWYVFFPMVILAAGLGAGAYVAVPSEFESYSTVSLLSSPKQTAAGTNGNDNPFLTFDSSLIATADFLGRTLTSTDTQEELKTRGVTEEYTVGLAENAQGPFLTITVTGSDRQHLLASTELLTTYAGTKLAAIQAANGVAAADMIRMTVILPPQEPTEKPKRKLQLVIAATGVGMVLAFLSTFLVEARIRARRRYKSSVDKHNGQPDGKAQGPAAARATARTPAGAPARVSAKATPSAPLPASPAVNTVPATSPDAVTDKTVVLNKVDIRPEDAVQNTVRFGDRSAPRAGVAMEWRDGDTGRPAVVHNPTTSPVPADLEPTIVLPLPSAIQARRTKPEDGTR